ncbi:MAG: acetate--CoA ligase family protein, partial [Chloroflexota bacterium]
FDPQAAAQAARQMGGPVLVAKQLARGPEVFCGMKRDPQFGPVLAVGRGGTDVEQTGSTAIAVGPLDLTAARQLVSESGASVEAEQALAEVLVALSRMSFDHPEVSEIDVNPLIVSGSRAVAVDALVVLDGRKS